MDVQAISPSPFHFMYWLPADVAIRMSQAGERAPGRASSRRIPTASWRWATSRCRRRRRAAAELEYCVKQLGFRGCEIGTNVAGARSRAGGISSGRWRNDLDVVVFMHPNGFTQGDRLTDHYFTNVIGNPLDTTVALGHIVFDGLLERFAKLKLVAAHGGGYIAHYPARMDHVWGARVDARTVLKKTPRQSLRRVYFDTIVFEREQLRHLVNLWGADHVLVGTDYPYDMGMYDPRGFVDGAKFLSAGDRAKIKGLNAAKLLEAEASGRGSADPGYSRGARVDAVSGRKPCHG